MKSSDQTKGMLLLIPNMISETESTIDGELKLAIQQTRHFLVETPKVARRLLQKADKKMALDSLSLEIYDKKTTHQELEALMQPLKKGHNLGIISDSGMPGIADPGSMAVLIAHQWGIKVKPFVGASSVILALAASGLPGQQFCFNGYLPISPKECADKVRELERDSSKSNSSQIFIETPYRNKKLFNLLLKVMSPSSLLCVAYDLTGPEEAVFTKSVQNWKDKPFTFNKLPCVFVIYSGG